MDKITASPHDSRTVRNKARSEVRYLTAKDALPARPQRVIVAGTSGAGKTHLAARSGAALQIPHVEMDALHHGPGWVKRPTFEAEVAQFAQLPQWVTEWQPSEMASPRTRNTINPPIAPASNLSTPLTIRAVKAIAPRREER